MSSVVISGDSSGTVSLTVPSVAGTNIATLPAATGTVMVSGNMPAFRAYVSSVQTGLTKATSYAMALNSVNFDTASRFNATGSTVGGIPAYSFLPNVAGYYLVNSSVYVTPDSASISVAETIIYKNGGAVASGVYIPSSTNSGQIVNCSDLIYLNGTSDYLTFYGYADTTSGTWTLRNGSSTSYVSAILVRSA